PRDMTARAIVFPERGRVELREEATPAAAAGGVVVAASLSLVSTGTELTCLHRRFAPGTHWDEWVRGDFRPGYSLVGRVADVGAGVEGLREGDRVACHAPHASSVAVAVEDLFPVPADVADEDAVWFALASIAQIAVERGVLVRGEAAAVLGLGVLGQM